MAEDTEFTQFVAQATSAQPETAATENEPAKSDTSKNESETVKATNSESTEIEKKEEQETKQQPDWKKAAAAEKAKREARQASKSNELKLQQRLQQVEHELNRYKSIEAKKDTDPLAAAEEFGLNYDRLTKEYIKTLDKNPESNQNQEVKNLVQKIQHIEGLLTQQQQVIEQRAQAEAIQSFNADVKKILETKGEEFEYVRTDPQGLDLVREIVAAHFRATSTFDRSGNIISAGELMPTEHACKLAEKHLDDYLGRFKGTKKLGLKTEQVKTTKPPEKPTLSQDMRTGGTKPNTPHGDEIEQLLLLKKTLEAQLNANQGN